jgi:2-oxoglutarate ferredoxin oxidoreductase subunit delta
MDQEDTFSQANRPAGESGASPAPAPEDQARPEYEIDIFRDWCKSCGICAAFCPRHCLSLDAQGAPVVQDSRRCTGCRWCELHCPDFAICVRELTPPKAADSEQD